MARHMEGKHVASAGRIRAQCQRASAQLSVRRSPGAMNSKVPTLLQGALIVVSIASPKSHSFVTPASVTTAFSAIGNDSQ